MKKVFCAFVIVLLVVSCKKEEGTTLGNEIDASLLKGTWSMYSVKSNNQISYFPNVNKNYEYWKFFEVGKMRIQRSIPSETIEIDTVLISLSGDKFKFGFELNNFDQGDSVQILKLSSDTFMVQPYTNNVVFTFIPLN